MRIAVVSDIHGNLTAFEAVLADLRETSPDLIFHGGNLADAGSSPVEIVDRVRDLGWNGVLGNADEMLFAPESLSEFASQSSAPPSLWPAVEEGAAWTRASLGADRLGWLRDLPRVQFLDQFALLHASPATTWRAPMHSAPDAELDAIYSPLGRAIVVYGHIHTPFARSVARPDGSRITVANAGSVSLSNDGDPRAAYFLLDDLKPTIRRVAYDVGKEIDALSRNGTPNSRWIARWIETARPQTP